MVKLLRTTLLLLLCMVANVAWGDTWTYTFAVGDFTTTAGTKTFKNVSWSYTAPTYVGLDTSSSDRGFQIGSKKNPTKSFSLTTSGFSGTITKVTVNASIASSGTAKLSVSVGGTSYLSNQALTTTATDYSATGSASGEIVISFSNTAKAFYIKSITIEYSSSKIAAPTFNPAGGTYNEAKQVTITGAEGTTLKYTTDGTNPTNSTTAKTTTTNTATLTIGKTTTVKAVAVSGDETSAVASATYTIDITVAAPVFAEQTGTTYDKPYTISFTNKYPAGTKIYLVTGSKYLYNKKSGTLWDNAVLYNSSTHYQKGYIFKAIAVDAYGNVSDSTTVSYKYTGEVTVPYYENFDESLGNFSVNSTKLSGSSYDAPEWYIRTSNDIEKYGEVRHYAYASGHTNIDNVKTDYRGTAEMISPIINLTGYKNYSMNFGHAGCWFQQSSSYVAGTKPSTVAKKYCKLFIRTKSTEDNASWSEWEDITDQISTWFIESTDYDRVNSGNMSPL